MAGPFEEVTGALNKRGARFTALTVKADPATAASYGCFRMHNSDVIDLYARVRMGTPVVVMPLV